MSRCTLVRFSEGCLALAVLPFLVLAQNNSSSSVDRLQQHGTTMSHPATLTPVSAELRGDIFMARKMYREAIDVYRQAPADSAVIQNKIGISFHQLLQFSLAKHYYQRAVILNPHFSEAINNLGTVYYAEKSYKKAIVYYKRSLRYSQPTPAIYVNLGAAYFARHDFKHASEFYEAALQMDPDVFEHRGGFGTLMQERTVDELATFHLYLAKSFAKRGNNDRALMYLRKALEEGIHDRGKIANIPEFAQLKNDPGFVQLLAEDPKPL